MSTLGNSQSAGAISPAARDALSVVLGVAVTLAAGSGADARQIIPGGTVNAGSATSGNASGNSAGVGSAQAAVGRANAAQALSRSQQTLQSIEAMQDAARSQASKTRNAGADPNQNNQRLPDVPNGLTTGGLQVAAGVPRNLSSPKAGENPLLWQGASLPKEVKAGSHVTVTVTQNAPQALLNWTTFNIGGNTTVSFDQSAGKASANQWVAFNTITDPSGVPSQILGSIQAQGQVYVINQNGIIFGGASQVNAHAFVASSLPININLLKQGLLNNKDLQFLFSQLQVDTLANGSMAPFIPQLLEPSFTASSASPDHELAYPVKVGASPTVGFASPSGKTLTALVEGSDYTVNTGANGKTTISFTAAGLAKAGNDAISISYAAAQVRDGDILVQKGAKLASPTTADHVGGKIALIGPNVTNAGSISTPDGQTILAAGLQVGLAAHPTKDPSLRGLDVYIGAVSDPSLSSNPDYAGTAINSGLIDAPRASVTIAGKTVKQLGAVESTTSVSLNGRIDLLANYNAVVKFDSTNNPAYFPSAAGTVELGRGSLLDILPEWSSDEAVVGTSLALRSQINMQGKAIHLGVDSNLLAPNGNLTINAGDWFAYDSTQNQFLPTKGQVYLDSGATIDVAGSSDISVPVSENIVAVQLRGPELANSPLQRSGPLRGQTIYVDARQSGIYNGQSWIGTPFGDALGYIGLIQRSVGELTTDGGSVTVSAGNSVVMRKGSAIDVSGGWIDYTGSVVQTTQVVYNDHVYDISQAAPDRIYAGVYGAVTQTNSKWGITQTWTDRIRTGSHYESGYYQGGSGGSIAITAPTMALDGKLVGNIVTGARQQTSTGAFSHLSLSFSGKQFYQGLQTSDAILPDATSPNILIQEGLAQNAAAAFSLDSSGDPLPLRSDRAKLVVLSPDTLTGFGSASIDTSAGGSIVLPAGNDLVFPAGGSLSLSGANIDLESKITAHGGSLNFKVTDISPYVVAYLSSNYDLAPKTPPADPSRGRLTLGPDAALDTSGLFLDYRTDSQTATTPLVVNGGNLQIVNDAVQVNPGTYTIAGGAVSLTSYNMDLADGSSIDVSGGMFVNTSGKIAYGKGGSIALKAGQDAGISSVLGGKLHLGAALSGFGHFGTDSSSKSVLQSLLGAAIGSYGSQGGSLSIQTTAIQVGGGRSKAGTLKLAPAFFDKGGFGSFSLTALSTMKIAPNTTVAPVVESNLAVLGDDGNWVLEPTLVMQSLRTPVSLSFSSTGVTDKYDSRIVRLTGQTSTGAGSLIQTDPAGSVSLAGQTVSVQGSVIAPAGKITISAMGILSDAVTISADIGPHALLSTAGAVVDTPDPRGYHTANVLGGGAISISGNAVAEAGSRLDVSGVTSQVDIAATSVDLNSRSASIVPGTLMETVRIDSNAGSIDLEGAQELFVDATLSGKGGGTTGKGGTLTVSGQSNTGGSPLNITLEVARKGRAVTGPVAVGKPLVDSKGKSVGNYGRLGVASFSGGGFDSIDLKGTVQFVGAVTLSANRSIALGDGGVVYADSKLTIDAPYVALGQAFQPPSAIANQGVFSSANGGSAPVPPVYGSGKLVVNASLIDVGNLSLQNIGNATLTAVNGDVRGDGALDVAGNLTVRAGQLYPVTESSFTITAYDYLLGGRQRPGTVTFVKSGDRQLPWSVAGTLSVYGSIINQDGVLRAPFGNINLGWNGAGTAPTDWITLKPVQATTRLTLGTGGITSVSAVDPITGQALTLPYGIEYNGIQWIDPTGTDITNAGPPAKAVNLSAVNIVDKAGALIDIRGGGDLYAYRWVSGLLGNKDILRPSTTTSFAIVPGYSANYAPYAPFNTQSDTGSTYFNDGSGSSDATHMDSGYTNTGTGLNLSAGDSVYLQAGGGLARGVYTLLPARYALLPGAFLITPQSGTPAGTVSLPDGSSVVSGYRLNNLASHIGSISVSRFEIDPASVVRSRAEYDDSYSNTFFSQYAQAHDLTVPRLPMDSGQLVLAAMHSMILEGRVASEAPPGGRGGPVDISSPNDIIIGRSGQTADAGALFLDSSELSAFGADSLLIGGVRQFGSLGTSVSITAGNLTVDNAGAPLTGADVILVANKTLTLAAGSAIDQNRSMTSAAETLLFGDATIAGSGDGVLLRVSSDPSAQIVRAGVDQSTVPNITIGARATIAGVGLILDSTHGTKLASSAILEGRNTSLGSGQISLQLANAGTLNPTDGLVLSTAALQTLQRHAQSISLLSYSSLDIYGDGQVGNLDATGRPTLAKLSLHAAALRGFHTNGGKVTFAADDILLDNDRAGTATPSTGTPSGSLIFDSNVFQLGVNQTRVDQFADLTIDASTGIELDGAGGLSAQGNVTLKTPAITGISGADQSLVATGVLSLSSSKTSAPALVAGLGVELSLSGASVSDNTDLLLPSGRLTLHATGNGGDVSVGNLARPGQPTRIEAGGEVKAFYDVLAYTDGGEVTLISDHGNVRLVNSKIDVAAKAGGGNAGSLSISAHSVFTLGGTVLGQAGAKGSGGTFSLDVGSVPGGNLSALNATLNNAGFTQSRSIRVRTGDIVLAGRAVSHSFNLSTDGGSITVLGSIDASGATGGAIGLEASGGLTLQAGSLLTVAAVDFSSAGKGGSISLETLGNDNGQIDIQTGATIDMQVHAKPGVGQSAGELHLRAPQSASGSTLPIEAIGGTVLGESRIAVEGFRIFDLTATGGLITNSGVISQMAGGAITDSNVNVQESVLQSDRAFSLNADSIAAAISAGNSRISALLTIEPGAEIVNRSGALTLRNDWDLANAPASYGVSRDPGVLTLRASGNLVFQGSLSDGFGPAPTDSTIKKTALWEAQLLPAGTRSWSYRLVSGADLSAADFRQVLPLNDLAAGSGSLLLGVGGIFNIATTQGANAVTSTAVNGHYQVIRTGCGGIDISAGRDVQLLNQFATIYTAGTQVNDPSVAGHPGTIRLPNGGLFDLPVLSNDSSAGLGKNQTVHPYPAQFSDGGGDVNIFAQGNILHSAQDKNGNAIPDSERQTPNNWLYRRGYLDSTGQFGTAKGGEIASTAWWVDFSNFFEGVGALGGGNVSMIAGNDIVNVDAVVPTNGRMPKGTPKASQLVELGGGDLTVKAGHDISGGVYYVERGNGSLTAGDTILTNSTRSPSYPTIKNPHPLPSSTWLPTTLFLGNGQFEVSARGDLLLGPVVNPFLLPEGMSNTFWYKTYFSTYAPASSVTVSSLTGVVQLRECATLSANEVAVPLLQIWLQNVELLGAVPNANAPSYYQPWLRLDEVDVSSFQTVVNVLPPTLNVTAFSGDISIQGKLLLAPAARGTINLFASGAIDGLQPNGVESLNAVTTNAWTSAFINLSDADPSSVPGVASPFAFQSVAGTAIGSAAGYQTDFLHPVDILFDETGALNSVLEVQQALHAPGVLHAGDSKPVHLYADSGDISGLTLFSAKATRIDAGRDVTDVGLYLQNTNASDISLVASGRDIVAYDENSKLRTAATTGANALTDLTDTTAHTGDIQISGPGTLEVLAGRNFDLGVGPQNGDGTAAGLLSIGNERNPYLPSAGASLIAAAGVGASSGLDTGNLAFASFVGQFVKTAAATRYFSELTSPSNLTWAKFQSLPAEEQDTIALDLFFLAIRDAGRDHNNPASPGYGSYKAGFSAIADLFPGAQWSGDITLTSREIKTENGGDISLLAPGGQLIVGFNVAGVQALDQGIFTEAGGNISIFTNGNVTVGTSRIFTLRGGNEIIWSSFGNIAAGASSKTVQAAPPERVLIDPQTGDVKTDLSGLATGGGIGVLASSAGIPPGDVDLIAPSGIVDAGDAGIRVSGNINVAAFTVLNASNIQASGASMGTPSVAAPSVGLGSIATPTTNNSTAEKAVEQASRNNQTTAAPEELSSIVEVQVVQYGDNDNP